MWPWGPKSRQCLVYPRPDATLVESRGVVTLGPRPYPIELGQAVLKALKSSGGRLTPREEPSLACSSDGKTVSVDGQPVDSDPRLLGEKLLELAARPSGEAAPLTAPRGFSRGAWLAARCSPDVLLPQMGLRRVKPCTWEDGLSKTARVFVTPRMGDWTLAWGLPEPDPESDAVSDPLLLFVEGLSQRCGRVAYFASNPGSGLAAWALAEEGTIARAFAYLGELAVTLWRLGLRSPEERALPEFFDSGDEEADDPAYWQRADLVYPEAEHVLQMARAWTIDPSGLTGEPSAGWSGELRIA